MFAASKSGSAAEATDAQFNYVTMLLHGDGTNGAQNNTFLDSSTNNFTITRNGNTTQGTFTPYGSNWSNYLNGSSYFTFGTTASNFLCTGSATGITATFEAWVFLTAYSTGANSYNFSAIHAKGGVYFNFGVRNGAVRFYWYDGAEKNVTSASTSDVPLNTWTHIALTISGSTIKIYINGVLNTTSATYTGVASAGSGATEYIGLEINGTYLNGYISNYRFTNTVVYSAAFTPSTTPLTAVSGTALLTCQSNRFVDNSSNNFTITVAGGSPSVQRFSPFSPTTAYSTSVIGGSGYFDGSGDYLTAPQGSAFQFSGDFTIECFVYSLTATGGSNYSGIFDTRSGNVVSSASANINFKPDGYLNIYVGGTNAASSTLLGANQWVHVAMVRSGSTVTLYQNGVSVATVTTSANLTDGYCTIGGFISDGYWNGYISNTRVVKGTAVYTSTFTPPTAPLTAITNTQLLLSNTNAGILDNAMMNDLETVGNAQISTSVKKYGTGSMAFDGSGDYLLFPTNKIYEYGTGDFTIEAWIYPLTLSATNSSLAGINSSGGFAWLFIIHAADIAFYTTGGTTTTFTTTVQTSVWQHVAITRASGSLRCFLNGTQVGSTVTLTSNLTSNVPLAVGANMDGGPSQFFNGYIDDFRITKGLARYTANFTAPTAAFADKG